MKKASPLLKSSCHTLLPTARQSFALANSDNTSPEDLSLKKPIVVLYSYNAGLLLLTGMLWGCTNPFIRQGTRGLRKVKADTRLRQACAEIKFLLGNWKYVLPWLINQVGSLVYLLAVQRVPLSVAVPAANSLAFAFTALTGATIGSEQPLDYGSILGIVFIGIGTTLCCWAKAD